MIVSLALLRSPQTSFSLTSTTSSDQLTAEEGSGACKSVPGEMKGGVGQMDFLLVGLGGGALPMFLNKCIPNVRNTV